jgi:DNA-binding NarL/FixJ family response regulator
MLIATVFAAAHARALEAECGEEALAIAADAKLDLVVLDVHLPGMSGYEVCRTLKQRFGDGLPIILLSGERVEPFDRVAGLLLGADDYLVKPCAPDELVARARRLIRVRDAINAEVRTLTKRETEVLTLIADGVTTVAIAASLVVTPKTVSKHLERIFQKLDVHTRTEAVAEARRRRLLVAYPSFGRACVPHAARGFTEDEEECTSLRTV